MQTEYKLGTGLSVTSRNGLYVAEFLSSANWMVGTIAGRKLEADADRRELALTVMDNIKKVDAGELLYSSCTDGRFRENLEDGQAVPVREQLVGADVMTLFVMAEALGNRFYKNAAASVVERLDEVFALVGLSSEAKKRAKLTHSALLMLSAHVGCGAAGGFLDVLANSARFVGQSDYTHRQQQLMGQAYDLGLHKEIAAGHQARLSAGKYESYSADVVLEKVRQKSGPHAVEHYRDDGRGVYGHVERAVAWLDESMDGYAVSPNGLAAAANGDQVFGMNAGRLNKLARLFGLGGGDDTDFRIARMAGADFASAGHGTLAARGTETMIIRKAAA